LTTGVNTYLKVHQLLQEEMMLKTAKSIRWNPKLLPAHGTLHFILWHIVLETLLKAFEAEGVKTGQRLWIVKLLEADRTSCEICGN